MPSGSSNGIDRLWVGTENEDWTLRHASGVKPIIADTQTLIHPAQAAHFPSEDKTPQRKPPLYSYKLFFKNKFLHGGRGQSNVKEISSVIWMETRGKLGSNPVCSQLRNTRFWEIKGIQC